MCDRELKDILRNWKKTALSIELKVVCHVKTTVKGGKELEGGQTKEERLVGEKNFLAYLKLLILTCTQPTTSRVFRPLNPN